MVTSVGMYMNEYCFIKMYARRTPGKGKDQQVACFCQKCYSCVVMHNLVKVLTYMRSGTPLHKFDISPKVF
jgi:hypothetical protein